ncbi:MAG TPA: MarR family transcriptional regulator, partial [Lachnospiraceae bacterium]|nr:MarR family transcriptional regulator [Lachnospiraceae bacterium]
MDDRLDEVIKKYPVTVKSRRRIRGAVLLDTNKGI